MNQHSPIPSHRYDPECQCRLCRCVSYSLKDLPIKRLSEDELKTLLQVCYDYGTVREGDMPNLETLLQARAEHRLYAFISDAWGTGTVLILGPDICLITFKVDD